MKLNKTARLCGILIGALMSLGAHAQNWPQGAGPNYDWSSSGDAATHWSLVRSENILWKTPMPEAGMSSLTVWGDKAFVTTHKPTGSGQAQDVVGYCLNAKSGEILWQVELPGSGSINLGNSFSDGTTYPPVTDGKHVWFFNRLGSMGCYDFTGKQIWFRKNPVRFRHANRMHKPILIEDSILVLEIADKKLVQNTKKGRVPKELVKNKDYWTYIHALDKKTGDVLWRENVGTTIHATPNIFKMPDGNYAIMHSRGGNHKPPETPYGYSVTMVTGPSAGKTLWSAAYKKVAADVNGHTHAKGITTFGKGEHIVLDKSSGKTLATHVLNTGDSIWSYDKAGKDWVHQENGEFKVVRLTEQSNILVGDWHYFRCFDKFFLGRVNVITGRKEYLELPAQRSASEQSRASDTMIWRDPKDEYKNAPVTASGVKIASKRGMSESGWGHISAASPTLIGKHLYIATVTGTVYVIDTEVEQLSPDSLVAINDMGPSKTAWSLAPITYADGVLFFQTAKEIFAVGN